MTAPLPVSQAHDSFDSRRDTVPRFKTRLRDILILRYAIRNVGVPQGIVFPLDAGTLGDSVGGIRHIPILTANPFLTPAHSQPLFEIVLDWNQALLCRVSLNGRNTDETTVQVHVRPQLPLNLRCPEPSERTKRKVCDYADAVSVSPV